MATRRLANLVPVDEIPETDKRRTNNQINWPATLASISNKGWHRIEEDRSLTSAQRTIEAAALTMSESFAIDVELRMNSLYLRVEPR